MHYWTKQRLIFKVLWPALLPIALMVMVALNQMYLYNVDYLNRWKGGGFGMFSTINRRYAHLHLIHKGALECAVPPSDYGRDWSRITHYPNYRKMEALAKTLSQGLWVYTQNMTASNGTSVRMIDGGESPSTNDIITPFDAIDIQVFDIAFYSRDASVVPKLLRKIRHEK